MFNTKKVAIEWGGKTLTLETGKVARQADRLLGQRGQRLLKQAGPQGQTLEANGSLRST